MNFDLAGPALFAVLVWWFTTGVILWLDGLPRRTHVCSMYGMTALAVGAVVLMSSSADDASVGGVYAGFVAAVLLWGWLEMSFLMGYVTGPRRVAAGPGIKGWQHFTQATQAVIYHELAIAAAAALVWALTRNAELPTAWWTFCVLWAMRLSAKLNLFLGVPNVNEELLPAHLKYLGSYFRKRPMNLLFPLSVTVSTLAAAALGLQLSAAADGSAAATALTLVLALLVLAILEHWFMVVPLPVNGLWRWALRARADAGKPQADPGMETDAGTPGMHSRPSFDKQRPARGDRAHTYLQTSPQVDDF